MTGEQRVFAIEGYGSDGVFNSVVFDFDAPIVQECLQRVPVIMDVCELFAQSGFCGDPSALLGQPKAEAGNQRGGFPLAGHQALLGCASPDTGFDLVDLGDAAQTLGSDFGAVILIDCYDTHEISGLKYEYFRVIKRVWSTCCGASRQPQLVHR